MESPTAAPALPTEVIAPPAAPLAAPAPAAPSPMQSAITAKDPAAYMAAKRDAKLRSYVPPDAPPPVAPVTPPAEDADDDAVAAAPVVAEQPPRTVSKRQQEKNDLIRARVEAEQKAERLEARLAALERPAPTQTAAPVAEAEPDPTDLTKYPDGQYDRKFIKDQARWEADQLYTAREAKAQTERQETQREHANHERKTAFSTRMKAIPQAEYDALSPDVTGLLTFEQLAHAKAAGHLPADTEPSGYNTIAEAIVDSSSPQTLMQHFSDHPDELHRIARLRPWDLARALGKLEGSLEAPTAPAPPTPQPKTISSMPAPGHAIGSHTVDPDDPEAAALRQRNFPAYQAAKRAKERAAAAAR